MIASINLYNSTIVRSKIENWLSFVGLLVSGFFLSFFLCALIENSALFTFLLKSKVKIVKQLKLEFLILKNMLNNKCDNKQLCE